jgi:hypothetical protein
MIAARPALERRVLASLDAGRVPVVLGGCGTGRTSLLLRLAGRLGPSAAQYLDLAAVATTPERCLQEIAGISRLGTPRGVPESPREAFDALLGLFDGAALATSAPPTFLLDEFQDVRTFENFPGLRHVQRDFVAHVAVSPARFVLASRFTSRVHRLLRDAPARFEVIHVPPLEAGDVVEVSRLFNGPSHGVAPDVAALVASLAHGRAAYVHLLLEALGNLGPAPDPVAALASLLSPDGRLTARCRESYDLRLARARGYGALRAILGVLAESEPLNLTEISLALHRTPGSTKDYLSWLEDVDLVSVSGKRYVFDDAVLRLYLRLYGRPVPPGDDQIVREVGAYARAHLPAAPSPVGPDQVAGPVERSGIIEID